MTGRTRRASTSSVETVDEKQIRWRQETSVLKSVSQLSDSDEWPIFELRDAVVLNKDGETLENGLNVSTRGPYIIRGTLIIDSPEQKQYLLMKVRFSMPLEIRQSSRYSIGEAGDGNPIIWVSGKGGWFEINPSPAYLATYNKMCEGVLLYYRMIDIYKSKGPTKPKKGKAARDELEDLFLKYATMIGDGSTLEEVRARCIEHSPFLISQFMQERPEVIEWGPTLFYKWLTAEHADLVKKTEESLRNPPQLMPTPSTGTRSPSVASNLASRTRASSSLLSAGVDSQDLAPRQRSSRSRSVNKKGPEPGPEPELEPQPEPEPESGPESESESEPDPDPDPEAGPEPEPQQMVAPSPGLPMVDLLAADEETPFESVFNALETTYEQLKNTKHGLTVTGVLNKLYFANKFPTYKDGSSGSHRIPVQEVFHYNAAALLQRIERAKYEKYEVYPWLQALAGQPFAPVAIKPVDFPYRIVPRGRISRSRQHNEVRPASVDSGPSGTPSRGGKRLVRPGRQSGKKSGLRLASAGIKRLHSELETDSEPDSEPVSEPKRSHYFSDADDTMEEASSHDADDGEPIKIVIRADKLPSTVPRGPDGTWTCSEHGCECVVRGRDADECQERIRRHFLEHEEQVDRVKLAMTESSRGHMPINHLLDKIKKLGEKAQQDQGGSADGVVLPQSIKRKLLV